MSEIVYLIRLGDLYRLGSTKDMDKLIKRLKPDKVISTFRTTDPKGFEARLLRRYRESRIPETGYFKFTNEQLNDCIKQLGLKGDVPMTSKSEIGITFAASVILFLLVFLFLSIIKISIIRSLSYGLLSSSVPLFVLVFMGSFGGYSAEDLPLFSTWVNRGKAFFSGLTLVLSGYYLYHLSNIIIGN
tara:strand:+ start:169 stop:729 length:561 start_codon:yes stop_codon:yes gene_type:complete